jgi:hypothetical protein
LNQRLNKVRNIFGAFKPKPVFSTLKGTPKVMTDKSKITDINEAKRRVGAQKKDKLTLNGGYDAALRKQKGHKSPSSSFYGQIRWYHYLQLLLMLGLVVWMMRSCGF